MHDTWIDITDESVTRCLVLAILLITVRSSKRREKQYCVADRITSCNAALRNAAQVFANEMLQKKSKQYKSHDHCLQLYNKHAQRKIGRTRRQKAADRVITFSLQNN